MFGSIVMVLLTNSDLQSDTSVPSINQNKQLTQNTQSYEKIGYRLKILKPKANV